MPNHSPTPLRCDCHIHVFDRDKSYASSTYQPPGKGIEAFRAEGMVRGIGRAVLIQASIDGTDNRYLVETLRAQAGIELRGVAVIDEQTEGLDDLAAAGVRAIRVQDRTRLGRNDLDRLPVLARRAATMDWHVELNTEPARYGRLQALMASLPADQPLVLDHLGHVSPHDIEHLAGLSRLLDTGRVWIKLAPTRVSQSPDRYDDLAPLVHHLAGRYPDRCLWGSDWPHVMTTPPLPSSSAMVGFLERELTSAQFEACFSSNPAALYRF